MRSEELRFAAARRRSQSALPREMNYNRSRWSLALCVSQSVHGRRGAVPLQFILYCSKLKL